MEYQPLPERASCFPTSVCEEPFIETIPPTLTTDCLCSCDTLTCSKLITQLFEEMVCAEPTDEQLDVVLDVCCSGQGEDGIRDTIRQMDANEARRSCPGCADTCECSAGFILVYEADSADCQPCDGVTEFSPSIGGSKCEPIEECERGQEEVSAPTCCSLDRVDGSMSCQMCPAGHYTEAGCHGSCSSFTCRAGTHHHHDSDSPDPVRGRHRVRGGLEEVQAMTFLISDRACDDQGVPCLPVTTYDAGKEETAEPTSTSDPVCSQCELGATFKPVDGQAESCCPVTHECEFGTFQSQVPTLDSNRECTLECSECPSGRYEIRACSTLENFELFPIPTPTTDRICRDLTQCNPSTEYERRLCHLITKCDPGEQRIRAPTSTSDTKCEPCLIGSTDHDRNPLTACQPWPYGHYVPAGSIGSCEQFLCPAGTADVDRRNASTRCARRARLAWTLPPSLASTPCTLVTECDLGCHEVVRPTMRPTIFTDRQCRRCIEGLFYRDSNTDFCTRVSPCEPGSFETAAPTISTDRECQMGPHMPQQQHFLSNEYELVAPSLVNDRECQRVRSCQDTEYEWSSLRCFHRACVPAYSVSLVFDAEFNALVGTQSGREAFEVALGTTIATVASLNEDFTARLFRWSTSGDITVMGFTASPCEADALWTTRRVALLLPPPTTNDSNELKASDAVDSWTTTALLEVTPAAAVVHAIATATTADEVVVVNVIVFAFLTSSSNSKEVGTVLLVGTRVLAVVGRHRQSSVAVRHAVFDDASLLLSLLSTNVHMSHHFTFYPSKRGKQNQGHSTAQDNSHIAWCHLQGSQTAKCNVACTNSTNDKAAGIHQPPLCVRVLQAKKTHKAGHSTTLLLLLLLYLNASHQPFKQAPPVMPLPLATAMASCIDDAVASQ
ncbi:hypothetical protein PTSG_11044 [Salpingoeca rosetta]|uniref:TNFR-Cys domain-containing protein n=1 Tax=Salpingoeca rosetta (strain ATCC 50818 / BSB-021) TaxID=946362 RepID=F2USI6_SALR5|nr:uncharacterized protein PTSG_11044 [Salpingoeca rosetta]EGD81095.1 hypothetical protein PTSG_11044 [Salpingoeca rosetta]|eukprot:XP_004987964.1 hypothetical protein PTSG_11044 [Salpingoeca rosetta]